MFDKSMSWIISTEQSSVLIKYSTTIASLISPEKLTHKLFILIQLQPKVTFSTLTLTQILIFKNALKECVELFFSKFFFYFLDFLFSFSLQLKVFGEIVSPVLFSTGQMIDHLVPEVKGLNPWFIFKHCNFLL